MTQYSKKNWFVVSKMTKIVEILTWTLEILKSFTLIGSFCTKYIIFEIKKCRGVMFHDSEEWCKIWRKTDLWFGKWRGKFGNFLPELSKVSKLGLWWDPFFQNKKCMSLKLTVELRFMKMKSDTKFEEEVTCRFKIVMRSLTNFDPSTQKSQKFAL